MSERAEKSKTCKFFTHEAIKHYFYWVNYELERLRQGPINHQFVVLGSLVRFVNWLHSVTTEPNKLVEAYNQFSGYTLYTDRRLPYRPTSHISVQLKRHSHED